MATAKTTRRRSRQLEQMVAADLGGRRVSLSGAGTEKGDARVQQRYRVVNGERQEVVRFPLRIECKFTTRPSYRLTAITWDKIARPAMAAGETPLMHIRVREGDPRAQEFAVLPYGAFHEIFEGHNLTLRAGSPLSLASYLINADIHTEPVTGWEFTMLAHKPGQTMRVMQGSTRLVVCRYENLRQAFREGTR